MKFEINAIREKLIIETITGTINITKQEVMKVTGCAAIEGEDSTAWYSYVEEAIEQGANFTQDVKVTKQEQHGDEEYTDVQIEW